MVANETEIKTVNEEYNIKKAYGAYKVKQGLPSSADIKRIRINLEKKKEEK